MVRSDVIEGSYGRFVGANQIPALLRCPDNTCRQRRRARWSRLPAALAQPPVNVRVADYLTYDAALSHADAWVHNGGFGAVCHGLAHGVPQVVAGEGMDKGENAAHVARSGCGVDLRTGRPGPDAVARAVP